MGHQFAYFLVVCQLTGNWAQKIHFRCQIKYWSILTGALVASCYLMGQLSTDLHVVRQFIGKWAPGYISVVNEYWNILAGVLSLWVIFPHILHVGCHFTGNWPRKNSENHFWCKNKYWSTLIGALSASSSLANHPTCSK